MCRKRTYLICFAAVLFGLYGSASAADNHWLGTAGDNEWGNVANWEDGHVPDAVLWPKEEAEIGYTTVGAGPILGVGDVGSAYRVFLGQNDGDTGYGELTMDGGTLTTSGYMSTAYHEGTSALITMNSGSVYIGDPAGSNGHLYLGRAGPATFNMNGGTFTVDDNLQLGRTATGNGMINLAGGVLQLGNLTLGAGTGLVDITGGTLILVGDDTAVVEGFITSGVIVAYGGAGILNVVYENDLTTVTAVSGDSPVDPTVYVIEQRIADELDDAEEDLNPSKLGEIDETSSDLEMPYEDTGMVDPQLAALRYANIAIPAGSYIANAWVRFQVDELKDGTLPVNLIIQGELNPNPAAFLGGPGTFDISARPRTATSVQWSVPNWTAVGDQGPDQTTVDIAPVIQEIIDQPGWASGNALVLIFSDDLANPSTGNRCAEAGPGDDSALLHIEYSEVAPASFALAGEHITATASSSYTADEGPEKTVDGSGLDADDLHSIEPIDMWISDVAAAEEPTWIQYEFDRPYSLDQMFVWNHNTMVEHLVGFGIKEATIEYSLDGAVWMSLDGTHEFARASGNADHASNTTIDFGGAVAKFVTITAGSNWGGLISQYGLSEVRFMYLPMRAHGPDPAADATDVDPQAILSWSAGGRAALHDVYVSANEQSVIDGTATVTTVPEAAHGPLSLDLGKTYYWRVDEVNDAEAPAVWQGDIWSFSTAKHRVVDDFESYTDDEGNRIYEIWLDGFTNGTGSITGHTNAPFAEQTIVYSGRQSLPLQYNNVDSPFYSETERTWATAQDWTAHGADTLTLYVRSDPNSAPASLYVAVQDSDGIVKVVTHPDGEAAVGIDRWQEWSIPLSALSDAGVNVTQVKTLYIGIGNRDNPVAGGVGRIYIDSITLGRSVTAAGYALEFDGVDDYVETPLSDVPKDGTVEAWVRTTVSDTRQAVISSHGGDQEFRVHLNYQPGKGGATPGLLGLNVRFRTLEAYTDIGSEMYDGSWHHVAFVWEGESPGTIRAYWDGQEKAV
ncbi:MAG: discoidin domain-containing protein, partial [Phycisphaerales bacterium]